MADVNFTATEKRVVLAFLEEIKETAKAKERKLVEWIAGVTPWAGRGCLTTGQYAKLEELIGNRFSQEEREIIVARAMAAPVEELRQTNILESLFDQASEIEAKQEK